MSDERPLADLIRELLETSLRFIKQELGATAQSVLFQPLKRAGKVAGLLGGAAAAVFCAVCFLGVGAAWGLGEALGGRYWASLLICAGLLAGLGVGLLVWARRAMAQERGRSDESGDEGRAG